VIGSTVRYKLSDDDVQDTNNPVSLPSSGTNLSWRKSSKINFSSTPAGSITNLRWFISGGPPVGIRFFARIQTTGLYIQASSIDASGITGFTDTVPNQNSNDAANYVSSAPLSVQSGTVLSNPNTGEGGDNQPFVETQTGVQSIYAGGPGPITPFNVNYRYA